MNIRITGAPTGGRVQAIPSKSAAHRIMIAAAMSGLDLTDQLDGLSKDITATKHCLLALMQRLEGTCGGANAEQIAGEEPAPAQLPCGESGSTLRFLIPLAGVLGINADFICEGRLPDRPMGPFLDQLMQHGCSVAGRNPKQLRGELRGGVFRLPGDISSQYVTGLLMALPMAAEDSRIIVEGTLQSRPYIDLTLEVLAKAGIQVSEPRSSVFEIAGGQTYRLPKDALDHIEGDWSNGAFWLVMDAMNRARGREGIDCFGLDSCSRQGDKAIVPVIDQMRAADDPSPVQRAEDPSPVQIDVSDIPDLVPAIAVLAVSRPEGAVTHITGAGRLRYKESDRLATVTGTLNALGAKITEEPEALLIPGQGSLQGGEISSCSDHRIVMMAAAAACICEGEILIRDAQTVEKSYPRFFEDYRMLGGQWEII
ncbi:MAG: 3-phosphoshikimate 1-carboxyvinyltransferase [Firmicutes bacterium]|nr:3-phosphoshikimate 1-carboxyvinyltransferase [Bacillota bacterium]